MRDVLAHFAVAARCAALQHAVAVDDRDCQAVDLRFADEVEFWIIDPFARQMVPHPCHPAVELLGTARVCERKHCLRVRHLLERTDRLGADALGRRVRRDDLRMIALNLAQLIKK
ncbi:unannotated protein [freshwater metagenome]|uniref:Unannotated protein n=1 Tax=freshwater metagenome TaxID=449393 RepID=A0A6J6A110_9ZZZZ